MGPLHRTVFAALLLAAIGCAPKVSLRVPPSAIAELPIERKLTLLDAENDLLAAVDARDLQEEKTLQAREAIDDAWKLKREVEEQADKARKAGQSPEVQEAAIREASLRIEWARADLDLQRSLLRREEGALMLAEARYEQTRAGEVLEAGLAGAQGLRAAEFQEQTDRLAKVADLKAADAKNQQAQADQVAAKWKEARAQLTRLTGGAQGSAWVQ
jgi:hypothetical protein